MNNLILKIFSCLIIFKLALTKTKINLVNDILLSKKEILCIKALNKEILAISYYSNSNITLFNITSGIIVNNLTGHTNDIYSLEFLNHNKLISGSNDKTIKLWNTATGKVIKTFYVNNSVKILLFINNQSFASVSSDGIIRLWNTTTGDQIKQLNETILVPVLSLLLINDGRLVSGSNDGKIRFWNTTSGKIIQKIIIGHPIICFLLLNNNKIIASSSTNQIIILWNTTTGYKIIKESNKALNETIRNLILINNETFASASSNGSIIFWNISTETIITKQTAHNNTILSLQKLEDDLLVSSSQDKTIKLWSYHVYPDGLINYWPMSSLKDLVGDADFFNNGTNFKFVPDRFGTQNSAIYFNQGYLQAPPGNYFLSGNFTVTAWIYLKSIQSWSRIIDFGDGEKDDNVIFGWYDNTSRICAEIHYWEKISMAPDNYYYTRLIAPLPLDLNEWHFVSFVFNGDTGYIYVNGSEFAYEKSIKHKKIFRNYNYIGKNNWKNAPNANAIYDEIKIFNVSLSHEDIIASFYSSFTTTTTTTTTTTSTTTTSTTTTPSPFSKYNNINNKFKTSASTYSINKTSFIPNYGNIFHAISQVYKPATSSISTLATSIVSSTSTTLSTSILAYLFILINLTILFNN
jgi:WD40 repeat protein